jgi:hypothetical protein
LYNKNEEEQVSVWEPMPWFKLQHLNTFQQWILSLKQQQINQ